MIVTRFPGLFTLRTLLAGLSLATLAALTSCGAPAGLTRTEVENIPPGNATGTDFSGVYSTNANTTSCAGKCPVLNVGIFTLDTCDVGMQNTVHITLQQNGGDLVILDDATNLVTRLEGGINSDGSFTAGGYATQAGGAVEITARVTGKVSADGKITAMAEGYGTGSYMGQTIDCTATYMVESQ
jgi:hypothetical protein